MVLNFSPADLADSADSSQIFVVFECAFVNCKNRRDPWEINTGIYFPQSFAELSQIVIGWFIVKVSALLPPYLKPLKQIPKNYIPFNSTFSILSTMILQKPNSSSTLPLTR